MQVQNVEVKAHCAEPDHIREILKQEGAEFKGTDHQTDTYFIVPHGRLKLRQGSIENNLIYYQRPDQAEAKTSEIQLTPITSNEQSKSLKQLLSTALGELVVVDKQREIYFIDNVKFHIDQVRGLGSFVEIEAISKNNAFTIEQLRQQCQHYMERLDIRPDELAESSYSDMLIKLND
ncbi:MAG: class IV adenylate cyclase [Bacteroidota bacterium]